MVCMKRRLFIAVPLPSEVKYELKKVLDDVVRALHPKPRLIPEENWHITVIFLGDQDEERVPVIAEALSLAAALTAPFGAELNQIVYGPDERRPRMLWVSGSRETSRNLGAVRAELEQSLKKHGIAWEEDARNFHAHATLARFPESRERPPSFSAPPFRAVWNVAGFDLMESTLTPEGALYCLIRHVAL